MLKIWTLSVAALVTIGLAFGAIALYGAGGNANPSSFYDIVSSSGGVYNFGYAAGYGSEAGKAHSGTIQGIAVDPVQKGYWLASSTGSVYAFGSAKNHGSLSLSKISAPIVGIASTADGNGYWLASANGGVYAFGDAVFHGSLGGNWPGAPIVGIASSQSGSGYWLVAANGAVFTFGSATFHGSMDGKALNKPIVGMAPTANGAGYWLVAGDGGVFSFGNAGFHGSMGGRKLNKAVVGMTAGPGGHGYWLVAGDGGVFSFNEPFYGSLGARGSSSSVVGIAAGAAPASGSSSTVSTTTTTTAPPTTTTTTPPVAPGIGAFTASSTLPDSGGTADLQWSTSNATNCTVSASPPITGMQNAVPCATGGLSVNVPSNDSGSPVVYTFTLDAAGDAQPDATASAQTTVQVSSPSVVSFGATKKVAWSGGTTTLQWSTSDTTTCSVTASPSIPKMPFDVPCSSGGVDVTIPQNTHAGSVVYTFTLDAKGMSSPDATATTKTVESEPPDMLLSADPGSDLVETGEGVVSAVLQVSTTSKLAGDEVEISSSQLDAVCSGGVTFTSIAAGATSPVTGDPLEVALDADGNATVTVIGSQCEARSVVFEADLVAAPYYSALETVQIKGPGNVTHGVTAFPTTSEVVTGNTTASGNSDVYGVFYVDASSVYNEQYVEIEADELVDRCLGGSFWVVPNQNSSTTDGTVSGSSQTFNAQLDQNGNAVFDFFGASCASGTSSLLASVQAGAHQEFSTAFTLLSPRPIIP
jgi:hypothetical protein